MGYTILCLVIVLLLERIFLLKKKNKQDMDTLKTTMSTLLHEIKNPITALMFQSEIVKDALPREYVPSIEVMDKEILRVAKLASASSEYLKNPVGEPQPVKVSALIREITKTFTQPIKINNRGYAGTLIYFDPEKARSVFENLIKNACESADGKDAQVEVSITQEKNKAVVRIMDRGKGFDQSEESKLFDLNYTTKKQGSGIGLYLSKEFVEAQKGSLKLYSREGGGAIAEVILPLWREK